MFQACAKLAVVCACLGSLACGKVQRQPVLAGEHHCQGNLSALGSALFWYHDKYGRFPPAYLADEKGKPIHSWRVLVLEWLDEDLYKQYTFKEPWDGPSNRRLADRMPRVFSCPNDCDPARSHLTNYVVVVGKDTAFPGRETTSLKDCRSDPSDTILIAEVAGLAVHWMEPRDLRFEDMSFVLNDWSRPSIASNDPSGPGAYFAHGCAGRVGLSTSPEELKHMLTITRRRPVRLP